jgi:hypothetical protein
MKKRGENVETVSTLRNDVHARNEARRNTRFGVGRKLVVSMAMGPSPPWPWLTAVRGPPGDDAPPTPTAGASYRVNARRPLLSPGKFSLFSLVSLISLEIS